MQSSVTAERGAFSIENMFGLIRFEAQALGLSSQQRENGLIIFHPKNFGEVPGIQSLSETSLLLYTDIETEGGDSPYTVGLWALEGLMQVAQFKNHICPQSRCVTHVWVQCNTCLGAQSFTQMCNFHHFLGVPFKTYPANNFFEHNWVCALK